MTQILRSLVALLIFTVMLGFGYTLAVTGIAAAAFPHQAGGSTVEADGRIVGSELLAQPFAEPQYFWPRPSASGYNANSDLDVAARSLSYPSNLGPTNPDLKDSIERGVAELGEGVPVDLVTSSGSGLDPHISIAAARWQVQRVARVRGLTTEVVEQLIDDHASSWMGRRYVNVLALNLALDAMDT